MNPPAVLTAGQPPSCVRQGGHPPGDAEQAEPADEQRGPADLGRRQGRVAVRVTEEPPADQGEQDRDGERPLAHDRAGERVDTGARQVVHPRPDGRGEHDREPEEEQADAVAPVIGLQLARVAAEPAHGRSHRPRDQQPDRADRAVEPARQDHHRVLGRAGSAAPRLVAAPFLAAADLAAADLAVPPRPVPARRALFPLDPAAPPRLDPLAPRPLPLPPRPLVPVPVPPPRAPERLAEVRDPAPRPEPRRRRCGRRQTCPTCQNGWTCLIHRTMRRTRCRTPAWRPVAARSAGSRPATHRCSSRRRPLAPARSASQPSPWTER